MSYSVHYSVWCNSCANWICEESTRKRADNGARLAGWKKIGRSKHICDLCIKARNAVAPINSLKERLAALRGGA